MTGAPDAPFVRVWVPSTSALVIHRAAGRPRGGFPSTSTGKRRLRNLQGPVGHGGYSSGHTGRPSRDSSWWSADRHARPKCLRKFPSKSAELDCSRTSDSSMNEAIFPAWEMPASAEGRGSSFAAIVRGRAWAKQARQARTWSNHRDCSRGPHIARDSSRPLVLTRPEAEMNLKTESSRWVQCGTCAVWGQTLLCGDSSGPRAGGWMKWIMT